MYQGKRIVAIIPARGGSKGIPNKNIIDVCGKPLISYSILAAQESKYIDEVYVSTDSTAIQNVALSYGAQVPFLRPEHLASDSAKTIDCMIHMLEELKHLGQRYDAVVLLQPTQPIRKPGAIDGAIEKLYSSSYDSLVSVTPVSEHPILMRTINDDGLLKPLLQTTSTVRRQDFPDFYRVNGNIYINLLNDSFNENTSLNDNQLAYVMDYDSSMDIDTLEDLEQVRTYIRRQPL